MMREIKIGNMTIAYTVRENAQTQRMTMHVTPGNVEVVIPQRTEEDAIANFVHRKRQWLFEKVIQVEDAYRKKENIQPVEFRTGAKIPYRGRMMKLHVTKADVDEIQIEYRNGFDVFIPRKMKNADILVRQHLEFWMKTRVEKDCRSFVNQYMEKLKVEPKNIKVKEQKHLWGSCSKDGVININWHLAFAPKKVLEYVVVHEMCHLRYRNHSKQFWQVLGGVFSEWEECKSWLEKNEQVWEMRV